MTVLITNYIHTALGTFSLCAVLTTFCAVKRHITLMQSSMTKESGTCKVNESRNVPANTTAWRLGLPSWSERFFLWTTARTFVLILPYSSIKQSTSLPWVKANESFHPAICFAKSSSTVSKPTSLKTTCIIQSDEERMVTMPESTSYWRILWCESYIPRFASTEL